MAKPTKAKAIERLRKALDGLFQLKEIDLDSPEFQKWHRGTQIALTKGDVEIPSDYAGVEYISFDDSEGWKMKLIRELQNVGFNVDANKAL